ncbi:hypothetical protein [Bradyrhizobium sp. STM 3557]|uniref:hypothetical protein n=1 Tax=Bradyrhizobium sp. STM 3557 TaxID=578920 RepID=UPI00388D0D12
MWPLLPFAAAGLGAASKLFSGFAASDAAELAAKQDRANAELSDTQAQVAKIGARQSLTQGAWQAGQIASKVKSTNAAATSYFTGHNINPALGSPVALEGFRPARAPPIWRWRPRAAKPVTPKA